MSQGYTAFVIDEASRRKLLEMFPAKYSSVVAHHITHAFDVGRDAVPPVPQKIEVVGVHDSGAMQVLVVEVDGQRHQLGRADEMPRFYHVTLSLDRSRAETHHSNIVLDNIVAEKGEAALRNLPEPVIISATPRYIVRLQPAGTACDITKAKIRQLKKA